MLVKSFELKGHQGGIYSCISYGNSKVFTSSADKYIVLWDLKNKIQDSFVVKCDESSFHINIIKSDILLICSSKGVVFFIDIINKVELKNVYHHSSPIFCSIENITTNQFYIADSNGNLSIWDLNTLNPVLTLPFNCGKIRSMHISSNGKYLYLCCQNGYIKILDTEYFNEIHSFFSHENGCNTLFIFNHIMYSAGKDGFIKLWNIDDFSLIKEIPAHNFAIYKLELFNYGKNLISISRDKSIKIWGTESMNFIQKIERKNGGHNHSINSCCKLSETELISVSDDKTIMVWKYDY